MSIHARLLLARKQAGLTQNELAQKVGLTRSAVAQWEAEGGTIPKKSTLSAVASATGRSLLWIEHAIDNEPMGLNVVGEVAAGTWREGSLEFKPFSVPLIPDPEYPSEAQRLYKVRGSSVNKTIDDGGFAHCVDVKAGGLVPEHGDLVIVRRMEHGLAEYTAKRLIKSGDKWILRPDSHDPAWQDDIVLNGDEATEIEITDIVIAKWSPIRRRL